MTEIKVNPNCPCTYNCKRHGKCNECQENYRKKGTPTACGK